MNKVYTNPKGERSRAVILLFIVAVLWSLGGPLIKLVDWNPVAIAGGRSAIAALMVLAILKKPSFKWSVWKAAGAASYAITVISFVIATKLTTAANAILIQYTAPVYVALFGAWFLNEKASLIDWISIIAVMGGMVLFFMDSFTPGGLLGNIIAIVSGISFAGVAMFLRKQKDESPLESVFWGNVVTALVCLPFMFQSVPNGRSIVGVIILGVVQIGLSYILYSIAIKKVTALEAVLIPVIEPILNPIWVALVVGEVPGKWSIVGGIVVLVVVTARCVVSALNEKKKDKEAYTA